MTAARKQARAQVRPPGPLRRFLHRNRLIGRAWLTFVVLLAAFAGLLQWQQAAIYGVAKGWTAKLMAATLRLLGTDAEAAGNVVTTSAVPIEIIGECTAVTPVAILISAIMCFPARAVTKLLGVALGIAVLVLVNQIRLAHLHYIAYRHPSSLEFLHLAVWQSGIVIVTVMFWLLWVALGVRPERRPPPADRLASDPLTANVDTAPPSPPPDHPVYSTRKRRGEP